MNKKVDSIIIDRVGGDSSPKSSAAAARPPKHTKKSTPHLRRLTLWRAVTTLLLLGVLGLLVWGFFLKGGEPSWIQSWENRGWSVYDESKASEFADAVPVWDVATVNGYIRSTESGLTVNSGSATDKYHLEVVDGNGRTIVPSVWVFRSDERRIASADGKLFRIFYDPQSGHVIKFEQVEG